MTTTTTSFADADDEPDSPGYDLSWNGGYLHRLIEQRNRRSDVQTEIDGMRIKIKARKEGKK